MSWFARRIPFAAAVSLFATACGTDATAPKTQGMCSGNVTLHVTAGTAPDISWTPDCKLFLVGVEDADSGHDHWFIMSGDITAGGGLSSPVHYGVLPPGAVLFDGPEPLQQGVQSRALAFRLANGDTANPILAGQLAFTP